ncbi:MAG: tetratricopeptide repeat protein [Bryobacterales bacterium]|nr:tetratricopeptide repeat protein [Bryobacterales bacterium]
MVAGVLAAAAAVLLVYAPALNGPFVFDDQYLPFFSPKFAQQSLYMATKGVRPLLMFSFWINNRWAGTEPYTYHLWNVLAHLVNAVLVFLIARKILAAARAGEGRREWLAAFAGAVFLLHPVQTESVAYVASRSENLSALFYFAAAAVFLYRKRAAIGWLSAVAVIALYGAAVTTKEHTITLVAFLLLTDYFWNPGFTFEGIRRNWRLYVPLAAAAAAGAALVYQLVRGAVTAGFNVEGLPWYDYLYTQFRALWVYLRLFVFPVGQNADYDYPISRGLFDRSAILGLAGLVLLVGSAWYFRKRYPLAAFGVLGALLLFLPTSSVVPIQDAVAERRLYLPMLALVFIPLEPLSRWKAKPLSLASVTGCVLAVLALLCYQRNQVWASDIALWEDVAAKSPRNSRAHFQLGVAYYQAGRCPDAARHYELAWKLGKPDYRLLLDWALAEDCLNRPRQALEKLHQAAAMRRTGHVYALIGMIHGRQKQYAEALEALATAEKIDPKEDMLYFYRGNVYAATGESAGALEQYRRALALNPGNDMARRAIARLQSRGAR